MYEVKGAVRLADGSPAVAIQVSAFDRDLRSEQKLGQSQTDSGGFYEIGYSQRQFLKAEKSSADLIVKALCDQSFLADCISGVIHAASSAEVDITKSLNRGAAREQASASFSNEGGIIREISYQLPSSSDPTRECGVDSLSYTTTFLDESEVPAA
jgi:hypothetical protein